MILSEGHSPKAAPTSEQPVQQHIGTTSRVKPELVWCHLGKPGKQGHHSSGVCAATELIVLLCCRTRLFTVACCRVQQVNNYWSTLLQLPSWYFGKLATSNPGASSTPSRQEMAVYGTYGWRSVLQEEQPGAVQMLSVRTCRGRPLFLHKLANLSQASTSSCMGTTRLRTLNKLCHTCSRDTLHRTYGCTVQGFTSQSEGCYSSIW